MPTLSLLQYMYIGKIHKCMKNCITVLISESLESFREAFSTIYNLIQRRFQTACNVRSFSLFVGHSVYLFFQEVSEQ